MTTNNEYYKTIYENVIGTTVSETHSDNWYLKRIAEKICNTTYSVTKCNGKYLKDIAEKEWDTTYPGNHFNNFYLHKWAEKIEGETLPMDFDNHFLEIIADGIAVTTSIKLEPLTSQITYGSTVTLTVTLLDAERQPISGETVTLYEGETSKGTGTTGSDGETDITVSGLNVGTHTLKATYDEYTSNNVTVTVNKIVPTITASADDDSVVWGENIVLEGVLSVGSGETVKLYDGVTLIDDDITTTTDGVFTKTISQATVGNHSYSFVYDGDATHESVTSDSVLVTVTKKPTVLDIDVPLILVYDDSFNISGNLSDGTNAISGASIGLKVGSTIVESINTDSNGDVAFTHTPVTMGTHTFQLVYAGDEHYDGASSTAVQRNIEKETTVLSDIVPATSSVNISIDESLTISGTLTDNDSPQNPIANASILIKVNDVTLTTLTTDSDGDFTGSVSGATLGMGTHSLEIRFAETANYATTFVSKEIVVGGGTLSFSASPSILSYADGDTATLTATLTAGGVGVSGEAIVFEDTNATPILEDLVIPNVPDENTYQIGSKWKLIATGHNGSQIDMYDSSGRNIIRVVPITGGYTITRGGATAVDLTGSVLYYDNGLFYTDTGDSTDTSSICILSQIKFMVYVEIEELTPILGVDVTDSSGVATGEYVSAGSGDVVVGASVLRSSVTETFTVEDCVDTILGGTDQSSKFGSSIGLRNSGTGNITYDSTNQYYVTNLTKKGSEAFVPINSANGLDDVLIEFDGFLPTPSSSLTSFLALGVYHDSNNWARLGEKATLSSGSPFEYGINNNGSYSESDISGATTQSGVWLHLKFKITNNTIQRQAYNGTTLVFEETRTYSSSWFDNTTKYGFNLLWTTAWKSYIKNIKIKPL